MSDNAAAALPVTAPVEVADGVWAYAQWDGSWWINTTGFVSADTTVAIDACATEARTRAFIDALVATTGRRAGLLVNTHAHGDHTFGNSLFHDAVIVGHDKCRDSMLEFGAAVGQISQFVIPGYDRMPDWGDIHLRVPQVTFESRLDLWVGELAVQLIHLGGSAHTNHDVIAWIPQRQVVFSGDLIFNGGVPLAVAGSVAGAITALERLRQLRPTVIVPGHGQPCAADAIDFHLRYWHMIQEAAGAGIRAGLTPLETARDLDQGEFAELTDGERVVLNLHRAYKDIDDRHHFDIPSATADAIAFSGRPIRCIA